jgi:hypothetical protein
MQVGRGAVSRLDDRTEICSACGTEEALGDFLGVRLEISDWPVRRLSFQASPASYPPDLHTTAERRRWRLVTRAALIAYGFELGEVLSGRDRMLIEFTRRSLYESDLETGEGDLSAEEDAWLRSLGFL